MNNIKIEQVTSPRSGGLVKNQFTIYTPEGKYFQSYDSVIAFVPNDRNDKVQLDETSWNFSITTSKYRNQFLGESTKDTMRKIDSGEYVLANLN